MILYLFQLKCYSKQHPLISQFNILLVYALFSLKEYQNHEFNNIINSVIYYAIHVTCIYIHKDFFKYFS